MGRVGVFVVVALVVGAITFFVADTDESPADPDNGVEETTPSPSAEPEDDVTDDEPPAGFDAYENAAGYSFVYPEGWNLDERRTAVEILAPDASAAMSFGLAPDGDIRAGIGRFLQTIEETYDVQEVRGPSSATVGTAEGVVVEGAAINDDGVRLEFSAYVIEGTSDNYAIAVFSSADADHADIDAVLGSFTTS